MQITRGGFFDDDPADEPPEQEMPPQPRWISPPSDEIPGRVLLDEVVARTDATVAILSELRQYGSGLSIRIDWSRRRRGESVKDWNVMMMNRHVGGAGDTGALRVGAVLPDGTRLLPMGWHAMGRQDPVRPPTLFAQEGGGGGGVDRYDGSISAWIWWPEPDDGELILVLEWQDAGIPETRIGIPSEVRAQAAPSRPLWEQQDE